MAPRSSIFSVFKRSPVWPLQDHMGKVNECVQTLLPFFEALVKEDWKTAKVLKKAISETEQAADTMKRDLRLQLPRGLFLAIPRTDILALLKAQDALANQAEDIAGLTYGRRMHIPKTLEEPILTLVGRSLEASNQANQAIHEIDELFVTGFSGKEVTVIEKMIKELHKIEQSTDAMQVTIRKILFKQEPTLPPVDVMFLYTLIDSVGNLADCADQVGARLQLLLAR